MQGIQRVAKVEAAACTHNDWSALGDSHKLPDKPAWPGSSSHWYTLHRADVWQHPAFCRLCFKAAARTTLKEAR